MLTKDGFEESGKPYGINQDNSAQIHLLCEFIYLFTVVENRRIIANKNVFVAFLYFFFFFSISPFYKKIEFSLVGKKLFSLQIFLSYNIFISSQIKR